MRAADAPTELLLIRHAESEWNASGRWQGHADPVLTPRGEQQAEALGRALCEALGATRPDLLLTSDLRRAWQTARAVGHYLGLEPSPDPRLRELDVGRWSGLTREEIAARDPERLAVFESGDPRCRPGDGETRLELRVRARRAVSEWVEEHPSALIAVVTHLGFLRALLPGEEPANADWLRISAREALSRRPLHESGREEPLHSAL